MVCGGMHAGSVTDFESVGTQATDAGFLKLAYQRVASNFECTMRDKACGQSRGIFCGQCAEELDTSSEVDSKIATALLDAVTAAALDAALLGKADASALASLLSTMDGLDTPLEVDTKIANALLGLATKAFVAAQLASRDASITALQGAKADATLLASYATNAALSASKTTLQSALDAILAELAALQLSGSGGVVNAPAWAGFTTWELVRGSNVVRNLHLGAPLSAALANGDDTLSITADCYSTAGTDAAITAALLAYYTSSQVDTLLGDYRTGTAQDAETAGAITAALLAYYTSSQVDALLGDYRTASAQDTQTQAAIAGALLAYRTGPDQDVFTTNQITSALVAYRSAADQDTATASSIAAALLSYYTGRRRGRRGGGRHRRADPGAHGRADQESGRGAAEGPSCEHHRGGHEDCVWNIEKQVTRGHAYFAERIIRTIKEAMLRCIAAGRRGQWHLMLADVLSQINGRKHATTQVAPNLAYSDPEMAEMLCATSGAGPSTR